jgi:hypothetical protein
MLKDNIMLIRSIIILYFVMMQDNRFPEKLVRVLGIATLKFNDDLVCVLGRCNLVKEQ